MMLGVILVRCQLCEELSFDPRTGNCLEADCGWEGGCFVCGAPLANPTVDVHCSGQCRGIAMDEAAADINR